MDYIKTGDFLKSLRKANGLTQEEVANHLLVSPKTVSRWECGDGLPDINIISDVAALYNVTVDEILKGERKIKEDNLKEETINFKNKNRDKALMTSILKPFNIYLIVAVSISLLCLLVGLCTIHLYMVGVVIMFFGIVIPTILLIIGIKITNEKTKDNEEIIDEELKQKIKNKIFFRALNLFDVLCLNILALAITFLVIGFTSNGDSLLLDLFITFTAVLLFYLIIRLPLINSKKAEIKKESIIAIIFICIIFTLILFWFIYVDYYKVNRVFFFYNLEKKEWKYNNSFTKKLVVLQTYANIFIYVSLILSIGLSILFVVKKKALLLFIPLALSILGMVPIAIILGKLMDYNREICYGIFPSIKGMLLVITCSIFIIILNKKNKKIINKI